MIANQLILFGSCSALPTGSRSASTSTTSRSTTVSTSGSPRRSRWRRAPRARDAITAGRFLGFTRDAPARIPSCCWSAQPRARSWSRATARSATASLGRQVTGPDDPGIIAAAVSGYAAIFGLLRFVRTHSYDIFVVYGC